MPNVEGFVPPPYPYDRLDGLAALCAQHDGGVVDLSIGTPCDPPPQAVIAALATSNTERGYPPSIGTVGLRGQICTWIGDRFGIDVNPDQVAACIGTKEFVATTPQFLKLRTPSRDTVLYPAVAYPTYHMGAVLAGCRPVPVPMGADGGIDLNAIDAADIDRALMLWVNSPSNPTGALSDLDAAAAWGRRHGVPVFSDECYVEFTWQGPARTVLQTGTHGVVAVHSLSKRSNMAAVDSAFGGPARCPAFQSSTCSGHPESISPRVSPCQSPPNRSRNPE